MRSAVGVVDISGAVATGIGAGGRVDRLRLLDDSRRLLNGGLVRIVDASTLAGMTAARSTAGAFGTMTIARMAATAAGVAPTTIADISTHPMVAAGLIAVVLAAADIAAGIGRELAQAGPRIDRPRAAEPTEHQRLDGIQMRNHRIAAAAAGRECILDGLALTGIAKHQGDGRVHGIAPVVVGGGLGLGRRAERWQQAGAERCAMALNWMIFDRTGWPLAAARTAGPTV